MRRRSNDSDPTALGSRPRIAIVGGGVAGASAALHIDRLAPGKFELVVFEPRSEIGRGLAYSSRDPVHRTNVPAVRMRIFPGDPNHFDRWYASSRDAALDTASRAATGGVYPQRHAFGRYLSEQVRAIASPLAHIRENVFDIDLDASGFILRCAPEHEIRADIVILAVSGNGPNSRLYSKVSPGARQLVIWNPWDEAAFEHIDRGDNVLIVGSGLTMADIVASLDNRGHFGKIVVVSRHGLRPQTQARSKVDLFGDFLLPPSCRARSLVARIRETVTVAEKLGLTWHSVLDQVHDHGNQIWHFLSWQERKRLMRHAWPYWNRLRFRVAPQLAEILDRKISSGQLCMHAASVEHIGNDEQGVFHVRLRKRGGPTEQISADHVAIATGIVPGYLLGHDTLVKNLCGKGLARPDPIRVGLDIELNGRAVDRLGNVQEKLFVVGTLTQGRFGDQVGAPDIASHALRVAAEIVKGLPELHLSRCNPKRIERTDVAL